MPPTGYNPTDGRTIEGARVNQPRYQPTHPQVKMPVTPDATMCDTHKTTTNEWHASGTRGGIQCEACHNPHTQKPKAEM
jgi:hypothetical protein